MSERLRFADPESRDALLAVGESSFDKSFDRVDLAAYAMLGSLLLNLDETITAE